MTNDIAVVTAAAGLLVDEIHSLRRALAAAEQRAGDAEKAAYIASLRLGLTDGSVGRLPHVRALAGAYGGDLQKPALTLVGNKKP